MSRGRTLRSPALVELEVDVSKTSGRIMLRVMSSGIEQLFASDIQELVVDLGREDLLVFRPGQPPERRRRE